MARKHTDRHEEQKTRSNDPVNSKDKRNDDFPGYPHYDKKEDIMDGRSNSERVNVEVENLPAFHNATTPHRLNHNENSRADSSPTETDGMDADIGIKMGTEADVSAEERMMLNDDMYYPTQDEDRLRQARLDDTDFDGEKLNEESFGNGQESGADLDMDAGSEEAVNEAMTHDDDEENQYWSLGGDEKENNVEAAR